MPRSRSRKSILTTAALVFVVIGASAVVAEALAAPKERKSGENGPTSRIVSVKLQDLASVDARDRDTPGLDQTRNTYKPPKKKHLSVVITRTLEWKRYAEQRCRGGTLVRDRCVCPPSAALSNGTCVRDQPTGLRPPLVIETLPPDSPSQGAGLRPNGGEPTVAPPPVGAPPVPPGAPPPAVQDLVQLVPDEMLVTLDRRSPLSRWRMLARTHRLRLLEQGTFELAGARIVRCRTRDGRPVSLVMSELQADARVTAVQLNYVYRFQQAAGGPIPSSLQYALTKLDASAAHQLAQGRGATVAVIDSGIDRTHPDLASVSVNEFDATADGKTRTAALLDSHGTAVAGIISGRGTVKGVAPGAKLLSIRAFKPARPDAAATASTFTILKGMEWAMANGARVLNLSFAGPDDPLLRRAIYTVIEQRGIVVAAAGNGGPKAPPAYPAAYNPVIAVTAIDADNRVYERANRGPYIDVAAPGVDILAPTAGKQHQFHSGTSFAAAHVSGLIALMLELNPDLDAEAVQAGLAAGADNFGTDTRREEIGAGLINAAASLRQLLQGR